MGELNQSITERRRLTRNKMYCYIYDSPTPVSKQEIARVLGFSLPTVHQNIAELLEAGLIEPGEVLKSTGGRPAVGYVIKSRMKFAVGISVSLNHIRLLASDLKQNEIAYQKLRYQYGDGENIGSAVADSLNHFMVEHHLDPEKMLGVGITFPGVIDRKNGVILMSPTMKSHVDTLEEIRKAIPYPVHFENDATSGGAAEWYSLPLKERQRDFVYLFLETGIGGAIFIDGKPYVGQNGRSGEFGHIVVEPNGRLCHCGQHGCLEAYCSSLRFSRDLGITVEQFFDGLRAGRSDYRELWDDVMRHLSMGIHDLRMAYDCDVILGGSVSKYLPPYLDQLKEMTAKHNPFDQSTDFLKLGKYPTKAGMRGVAWHFINEFISKI